MVGVPSQSPLCTYNTAHLPATATGVPARAPLQYIARCLPRAHVKISPDEEAALKIQKTKLPTKIRFELKSKAELHLAYAYNEIPEWTEILSWLT